MFDTHFNDEKLQVLFDSAPDGIIIMNHTGNIVFANHHTEILFGYAPKALLNQKVEILIPKRFHNSHVNHRKKFFENPQSRPMGKIQMDLSGITKEGKEFPVDLSLSPIETREGVHVIASIRDITQRKELENQLRQSLEQQENQNTMLAASNRKLEDSNQSREGLMKQLSDFHGTHIKTLQKTLDSLIEDTTDDSKALFQNFAREVHYVEEMLRPVSQLYFSEQTIQSKRVLLAETNKKNQIIAKMALGGTGMSLDITSNYEEGCDLLENNKYDIICVDDQLIKLVSVAQKCTSPPLPVLMTSGDGQVYLPLLRQYPDISNIISRNEADRTFTLKNILVTVSKLLSEDLFGLEKYLSWGVEVFQQPVSKSDARLEAVEKMESTLKNFGIRSKVVRQSGMVIEELLMNAIYDAPVDAQGHPLYNHLPRTTSIELRPEEQATLRYAFDGLLLGVSVEDPFGMLSRQIILDYLESCYEGKAGSLNKKKGGAGRGLFQIINASDLMVINVKPGIKTEVISFFNLDPAKADDKKTSSLHYFIS